MTRDRLLEQAIELLAIADFHSLTLKEERNQVVREGIELLRQPKPEPVAWWDAKLGAFDEKHFDQLQPLYTAPPQRTEQEPMAWEVGVVDGVVTRRLAPPQRKPLTDEAIAQIAAQGHQRWLEFARAIEAAHGIKGDA